MTKYFVDIGDETFEVEIEGTEVRVGGEPVEADLERIDGTDVWSLVLGGRSRRIVAQQGEKGRWSVRFDGESHQARVVDERTRHIEEMTGGADGPKGPQPVRAPMPGLVVRIEVAEGDVVRPGQGVVIVEAMKMENELKVDAEARVARILVSEGEAVEKDAVLIDLEALDADGEADG